MSDYKLYYFEGRNTGIAATSPEDARKKKRRGGDKIVAVRTPTKEEHAAMDRGEWVRTRRDGKNPDASAFGKGRGQGPERKVVDTAGHIAAALYLFDTMDTKDLIRRVRTPEGVAWYKRPVGTIITRRIRDEAKARSKARKSKYKRTRARRETWGGQSVRVRDGRAAERESAGRVGMPDAPAAPASAPADSVPRRKRSETFRAAQEQGMKDWKEKHATKPSATNRENVWYRPGPDGKPNYKSPMYLNDGDHVIVDTKDPKFGNMVYTASDGQWHWANNLDDGRAIPMPPEDAKTAQAAWAELVAEANPIPGEKPKKRKLPQYAQGNVVNNPFYNEAAEHGPMKFMLGRKDRGTRGTVEQVNVFAGTEVLTDTNGRLDDAYLFHPDGSMERLTISRRLDGSVLRRERRRPITDVQEQRRLRTILEKAQDGDGTFGAFKVVDTEYDTDSIDRLAKDKPVRDPNAMRDLDPEELDFINAPPVGFRYHHDPETGFKLVVPEDAGDVYWIAPKAGRRTKKDPGGAYYVQTPDGRVQKWGTMDFADGPTSQPRTVLQGAGVRDTSDIAVPGNVMTETAALREFYGADPKRLFIAGNDAPEPPERTDADLTPENHYAASDSVRDKVEDTIKDHPKTVDEWNALAAGDPVKLMGEADSVAMMLEQFRAYQINHPDEAKRKPLQAAFQLGADRARERLNDNTEPTEADLDYITEEITKVDPTLGGVRGLGEVVKSRWLTAHEANTKRVWRRDDKDMTTMQEIRPRMDATLDAGRAAYIDYLTKLKSDPAYRKLEKDRADIEEQLKKMDRIRWSMERAQADKNLRVRQRVNKKAIATYRKERLIEYMDWVRPMGLKTPEEGRGAFIPTTGTYTPRGNTMDGTASLRDTKDKNGELWMDAMDEGQGVFPSEWLARLNDTIDVDWGYTPTGGGGYHLNSFVEPKFASTDRKSSDGMTIVIADATSYDPENGYADLAQRGRITGYTSYAHNVAAHEIGHAMQNAVPGIAHMEAAFLYYREKKSKGSTKGKRTVYSDGQASTVFEDDFRDPYSGRIYHRNGLVVERDPLGNAGDVNYEVFTTGIEDLFGGGDVKTYTKPEDDEHIQLILGMLLTLRTSDTEDEWWDK